MVNQSPPKSSCGRRHLVERQRAGLVGVDGARRPQRLDVGEVAHDGLRLGQLAGAEGEHPLDERRHAGRDGRDGHGHAEEQEVARTSRPRATPTATTIASAVQATTPSHLVRPSSCCCSGDLVRVTDCSRPAILPTSVPMPVAVTTKLAVPRVTDVFWKSMSVRSPSAASVARPPPASLGIGALSPVRAASWVSRLAERTMRPSATTMSPASTASRSPGTTFDGGDGQRASHPAAPGPRASASRRGRRRWPGPSAPGGCPGRR